MTFIIAKTTTNKNAEIVPLWEDSEIRFDLPLRAMKLRPGERAIDRLDSVEDTKGNGGERGRLVVTNLRILWHSLESPRVSLYKFSIDGRALGYTKLCLSEVLKGLEEALAQRLRGAVEALYLLAKTQSNRYEFVFTNLIPGTTRLFTSVIGVHRAYTSSRMYRELKLRGAVVRDKQLQLLPMEQIVSTEKGVWNLSSDQGNLGTFFITNVRLIWFADMNEHFNLSLPYLQIAVVKIRESKFGVALVVETVEASGGYVLGFRIDPMDRLRNVHREITALQAVYSKCPIFGIEYTVGDEPLLTEQPATLPPGEEEVDWSVEGVSSALNVYAMEGANLPRQPPVYCPELGLAVELLKEGFAMKQLWEVLPES